MPISDFHHQHLRKMMNAFCVKHPYEVLHGDQIAGSEEWNDTMDVE